MAENSNTYNHDGLSPQEHHLQVEDDDLELWNELFDEGQEEDQLDERSEGPQHNTLDDPQAERYGLEDLHDAGDVDQPHQVEQIEQAEQSHQTEQTQQADQTQQIEHAEQSEPSEGAADSEALQQPSETQVVICQEDEGIDPEERAQFINEAFAYSVGSSDKKLLQKGIDRAFDFDGENFTNPGKTSWGRNSETYKVFDKDREISLYKPMPTDAEGRRSRSPSRGREYWQPQKPEEVKITSPTTHIPRVPGRNLSIRNQDQDLSQVTVAEKAAMLHLIAPESELLAKFKHDYKLESDLLQAQLDHLKDKCRYLNEDNESLKETNQAITKAYNKQIESLQYEISNLNRTIKHNNQSRDQPDDRSLEQQLQDCLERKSKLEEANERNRIYLDEKISLQQKNELLQVEKEMAEDDLEVLRKEVLNLQEEKEYHERLLMEAYRTIERYGAELRRGSKGRGDDAKAGAPGKRPAHWAAREAELKESSMYRRVRGKLRVKSEGKEDEEVEIDKLRLKAHAGLCGWTNGVLPKVDLGEMRLRWEGIVVV
ncbi:hypothetical protein K470DRAFT_294534 [Piedraia hortae CBS 480.64]|uniref:Uncharacterized protein n=1 Tax=Piedraia hortae CBS 480.64 TaxID=1314780 RepID=A0A6A7C233_9PEZI|nr:hypothetical protein K470DRAFT_294534 [Piedraia hortae CBS 480.64]